MHITKTKKSLVIVTAIVSVVGLAYKILVSDAYEKKVEDFYKTYNAEASLKRMNEAGLMESYQT
ncbi:PREDICTED: uncharacterized protein LOC108552411 [Eufriesea mexicana]|nr:PREDICTED: uncharacterized protein LOC108552411 [Eufriesea mexicana]